ncbi:MAG: diaminopimelate decarboxylase [Anaeroplasma sp.]
MKNMKISNVDVNYLKEKYNTPLYIYDASHLKNNIDLYLENFKSDNYQTEVLFASKAFCVKEMLRIVKEKNMSLDVVSKGELYTAMSVGFNPAKIYFHGNNKSYDDITYALNCNVGTFVVDNLMELILLDKIAKEMDKKVNILIRLNVGVEAHTHKFIVTAHVDSKFGVLYNSDDYKQMISLSAQSNNINLLGFHSHIGSQIFDLNAFEAALEKLIIICKDFSYPLVLNIGGGFGVHYTDEDKPIPFDVVSKVLIAKCDTALMQNNVRISKLCIEPGRSIVAEAGYTLYTVGFIKKTPNKEYYFIDGGMTDNIRPSLYQAKYSADIVGKENEPRTQIVTIAGKCCESGDLIIENYPMPKATQGDLLITYTTGAYGYSMSSNYNKALTPAVVFVEDGNDKLAVRRQTYEELIEREE